MSEIEIEFQQQYILSAATIWCGVVSIFLLAVCILLLLGFFSSGYLYNKKTAAAAAAAVRGPTPQRVGWTVNGPSLAGRLHGLGFC